MNTEQIKQAGDELFNALQERTVVRPLTERLHDITIENAYRISARILEHRLDAGEKVIGKKIGATSKAVQDMLNVRQPDFGYLTDAMLIEDGGDIPISTGLIQPKAEGEIAFVLRNTIRGPGVTPESVLAATDYVSPCFEIVDSRIQNWEVKIQDTVADNASCGLFVLGRDRADPRSLDLAACELEIESADDGSILAKGVGTAALGSPLKSVAWLANTLGEFGVALEAGEVVLSGSLVPLLPAVVGDSLIVRISGIGSASVRFT